MFGRVKKNNLFEGMLLRLDVKLIKNWSSSPIANVFEESQNVIDIQSLFLY